MEEGRTIQPFAALHIRLGYDSSQLEVCRGEYWSRMGLFAVLATLTRLSLRVLSCKHFTFQDFAHAAFPGRLSRNH